MKINSFKCNLCNTQCSAQRPMLAFVAVNNGDTIEARGLDDSDFHLCQVCLKQIRKIIDPDTDIGRLLK